MSQLEENLTLRLQQLEKRLEAYRTLHAAELDEIAGSLVELRREVWALTEVFPSTVDRTLPDQAWSTIEMAAPAWCPECDEWTKENEPSR